jgi:hypothetical protein
LDLVIDGQVKSIFAFQDASLKELRTLANLDSSYQFLFEGLKVSQAEESYIFVKEIIYGSKIIISSKNTS